MCSSFFFFKQKTAYEMRISDWSSDVCSSDLFADHYFRVLADNRARQEEQQQRFRPRDENFDDSFDDFDAADEAGEDARADQATDRSEERRVGKEWDRT